MPDSNSSEWFFEPGTPIGGEKFKEKAAYQTRMLDTMKDTISEYMDEANGDKLFIDHTLHALLDTLLYHKGMVDKIQNVIDRLEVSS